MAEYLDIATDIKNKLTAIGTLGVIHTYQRQAVDMAKFISFFARDIGGGRKEIRGCEITRQALAEHQRGAFFGHHLMVVRVYLGLCDAEATGATFQALLDTVRETFRLAEPADPPDGWLYRNGDNPAQSPLQIPVIDDRMFGNVLCHYAEIHISVTDRIVA